MTIRRTIFYVSDGTGLTAEALGHSLLTQFEDVVFREVRIPFLDDRAKAQDAVLRINATGEEDGLRPIVFTTLVDQELAAIVHEADAFSLSFFETFLAPLEAELGVKSSHTVGRSHGSADSSDYKKRIEAINYTLAHDDGITDRDLEQADVVLVAVSRCGKTPTSLYLAMQFGLKAANFPLIPEDFDRGRLPGTLERHRSKLFGLTIQPERLARIREERRPNSRYASLANCRHEVTEAEKMMRREGIRWLDSSTKSIEEIATTVLQELRLR
ncbi:MAG TPA: pyruvate, water dikinase regulatory protein [Rhodocyclaceae bacterium]|nr:pyruvate, water dikinase regulatory protein [Rhodocyclaceae bacterium]HMV19730.1 pyruvate, water dikinase regulatory protein [Rhodocyclaceae bacterium]HMW76286.1 pyruvate, water dikinase regulatory protein [Rhodocyclaceae bacterium]HNE44475.1 pyruvate, water dikinase regulatory protein [Rhodocyclaceae bacterium]HNL22048.1 pyruvate, water dikinase regulatory protein [Rhodocyclaceae bacterium]